MSWRNRCSTPVWWRTSAASTRGKSPASLPAGNGTPRSWPTFRRQPTPAARTGSSTHSSRPARCFSGPSTCGSVRWSNGTGSCSPTSSKRTMRRTRRPPNRDLVPGRVDDQARMVRQHPYHRAVLVGEGLAVLAVGHVERAANAARGDDGQAEQSFHLGVLRREAERLRVQRYVVDLHP